ncbi:hypothetical protein BOTBODRAFT_558420 [Botryobasidium botryosum FD-172 SS1]|uniref:Uncharacterized protein n=1 Tax=Botryobasidium botryosum (strain FD-172 SS1) TaxID=930990 RepID=A0A067M246_BOTB1|nr:hypothetical protein BOTBODRAFT_558420 [Botryobasidium botryosum FD-172 SS1]
MAQTTDRRRIVGPESSAPPVFEIDEQKRSQDPPLPSRSKRSPRDIRPIFLQTGLISQANGSAYIETERTKIACAVYGPRQLKNTAYSEKGKLNVEVKFAPFSCTRRRAPMKDAEDRPISLLIAQSLLPSIRLELFPKSSIDIFITVLENDGTEGCVAAGATAASAALADAGIELIALSTSCSASVIGDGPEIWLDPTEEESKAARGTMTVSYLPALGTLTNVWQTGKMSPDEAMQCVEKCVERCTDIHHVVSKTLLDSAQARLGSNP